MDTNFESSDGLLSPFYAGAVPLPLESVPNLSEGRDGSTLAALREAMSRPARLLDMHADADHHRSVYTLVGSGQELVDTLEAGIRRAVELIDLGRHQGAHPRVGAADVVPFVFLRPEHEPDASRRSIAGEGRKNCSGASTRASCPRTVARTVSIRPPVQCSSASAGP